MGRGSIARASSFASTLAVNVAAVAEARPRWSLVAMLGLVACGPGVALPQDGETTSSSSTGATTVSATTSASTSVETTSTSPSTSGADATTSDDGYACGVGIQCPDTLAPQPCDVWAQTCPEGDKCMPRATRASSVWNATRCSPVSGAPSQLGETCFSESAGLSGNDTCDVSLVCLFVDPQTNAGTCVANCTGSEANPHCDDDADVCVIGFDGVIISCLPRCDPSLQDCPENGACYPYGDTFVCGDTIDPVLQIGETCEYAWDCVEGSFCASAELLPTCAPPGCCTPYCDVLDPQSCEPDQLCMPLFRGTTAGYCI